MLTFDMQVGGPSKLVRANPENDLNLPAPYKDGIAGNTGIRWIFDPPNGGALVSKVVSNDGDPQGGLTCTFTALAAGVVTGMLKATSLTNLDVTYDSFTINIAPAPVNELTHFSPTVETV